MPDLRRRAASPEPNGPGVAALVELVLAALRVEPAYATVSQPSSGAVAAGTVASPSAQPSDGSAPPPPVDQSPGPDQSHAEVWELVAAAQRGDGEAFGRLYDRYVDTVFRYVYYRVNDRALAEDFTSETFLRALRRIGAISYQGRDIGAWFITIARNIVLDYLKSARHRLETTTAEMVERVEAEPGPEAAALSTLTTEHLMRAVGRLGEDQRECIVLRFIQGLTVSETAEIMGRNDGAIKALQYRAIRKLADLIGPELR